jgi:uncharacterized membrane protein YbhN (UPF0104 family)
LGNLVSTRFARLRRLGTIVFAILAVVFIVYLVASHWSALLEALAHADPLLVVACVLLAGAGTFCYMLSWRAVVSGLGIRLGLRDASGVFFVSQLGKYIPGAIWPILAAGQLGGRVGVPAFTASLSTTVALFVNFAVAATFAIGAVLFVPGDVAQYSGVIIAAVVVALFLLTPPVLRRLIALVMRVIRPKAVPPHLTTKSVGAMVGWSVLSWLFFGSHIWVLVIAFGGDPWTTILPSVSGYALAWAIGFLIVIAPAGAGVREAIMVLLFGSILSAGTTVGLVVVSRLALVLVDLSLVLVGLRRRGRVASSVPPEAVAHDAA